MSDLDLNAIEARANAATPGLWLAQNIGGIAIGLMHDVTDGDCEFVRHAREDVPALIAQVRELDALWSLAKASGQALLDAADNATLVERRRCLGIIRHQLEPFMPEDEHVCPSRLWQDVLNEIKGE